MSHPAPRAHRWIIQKAGGYLHVSDVLRVPTSTVRSWEKADSIPLYAAAAMEDQGWTTCRELSEYALVRELRKPPRRRRRRS